MATDFGDDVGQLLFEEFRRLLKEQGSSLYNKTGNKAKSAEKDFSESAKDWYDNSFQSQGVPEEAAEQAARGAAERTQEIGRFGDYALAQRFCAACREQGVFAVAREGEQGEGFIQYYAADRERLEDVFKTFSEKLDRNGAEKMSEEFSRVTPVTKQDLDAIEKRLPEPARQADTPVGHMESVAAKVEIARAGARDEMEFIARCKEQGLSVSESVDGELKFTENGWFDVRADTLKERCGIDATHDSFSRTPVWQDNPETRAETVKSHDGMDVDSRTRVVEDIVRPQPELDRQEELSRAAAREKREKEALEETLEEKGYDLDSTIRDARDFNQALDEMTGSREMDIDISGKFSQER